jgi:nickel transport protein
MKPFLRWSAALSLMGSVMLAGWQAGTQQAFALTDEQVMERLRPVPVFTITDDRGAPLVSAPGQGQGSSVAGVFISQQDALNFLNTLRQNNPQVAQNVRVVPVSLAEVYELARSSESQNSNLSFSFVPMEQQVQTARTLLQQSGENPEQFSGTPLFVARSTAENGGYLSLQQGDEQVMPMFFKREELQAMLDRLQQQQPDLVNQMTIEVVSLEGVIQTLQENNDPELTQILLVPPRETIDYIRSLQSPQGQQQPGRQAAPR